MSTITVCFKMKGLRRTKFFLSLLKHTIVFWYPWRKRVLPWSFRVVKRLLTVEVCAE